MPRKPKAPYPIDRPRQLVLDLMARDGLNPKSLSLKLKEKTGERGNETYIQQFIVNGKPRHLPEWAREALATVFNLEDPDVFRPDFRPKTNQQELLSLFERIPPAGREGFMEMARSAARLAADLAAPPRRRVGG